jgi:DNA-binding response OmpR family regulator
VTAETGLRCLEILDTVTPDLIMLDITMPGMNGWEVARAVRGRGLDQVMILMVSAEAKELTAPPTDDPPHDDYLIKPFNLSDLFERLETLLDLEWIYTAGDGHAG